MQVYGGHGFISEWGMEQYVRDSRINMIYEGTNTIQSLDLLGRKILMDNGVKLRKLGEKIRSFIEDNGLDEDLGEFITPLADLAAKVEKLTAEIGMKAMKNPEEVGAAAVPYLRVVGHLIYAYFFTRMAKIALEKRDSGDDFYKAKLATARFYFARLLPETAMLIRQARAGSASLMELDATLF
jgi:butyryl-CoA dehydrogenase